ncbi:MAG TPA: hypothetical protein VF423_03910 [Actinomycetes bacterium]
MRHSKASSRTGLSHDLEVLADRAVQRGAVSRANDLRAVAEHLRTKEDRTGGGRPGPVERRARSTRTMLRRALRKLRRLRGRRARQ